MIDDCDKIIYQPSRFGIYGLMSMSIVQCIYAIKYSEHTNIDVHKSFLIKNGRNPDSKEIDYINRVLQGEKAPLGSYNHNWIIYSSQILSMKHPRLLPSTKIVKEITENVFGHKVGNDILNLVAAIVQNMIYSLKNGYYGVNTWQPLSITKALDSIGLNRNKKSIHLLFNKIYKRDPLKEEITICKKIKFTCQQDMQHEIERLIKVRIKNPVSSRRPR